MDWRSIRKGAIKAATDMGHELGPFKRHKGNHPLQTAMCDKCFGCCWIAFHPSRGFIGGGRLMKYRCGTPEAAGFLPQTQADVTQAHAGGNGVKEKD